MIKISYGILCNDELNELTLLLELLILYIRDIDEVCVLTDSTHPNLAMNDLLDSFKNKFEEKGLQFKWSYNLLDKDFAQQKNKLIEMCSGDYIIQADADEMYTEFFMKNIHKIIEKNIIIDIYFIPRINTVKNLGLPHVKNWGWRITKNENYISEKIIDTDSDEYKLLKQHNLIIDETDI